MKKRKSKTHGPGMTYVIDTLQLLKEERNASYMYRMMRIRFKKTQTALLRWLVQDGLVSKRDDFVIHGKRLVRLRPRLKPLVYYKITDNGRLFLSLCQHYPSFFSLS